MTVVLFPLALVNKKTDITLKKTKIILMGNKQYRKNMS